jgi:hypothetical protein
MEGDVYKSHVGVANAGLEVGQVVGSVAIL